MNLTQLCKVAYFFCLLNSQFIKAQPTRWVLHSGINFNRLSQNEDRHFNGLGLDIGIAYSQHHNYGIWDIGLFTSIGPFPDIFDAGLEHSIHRQRTLILAQGAGLKLGITRPTGHLKISDTTWWVHPSMALEFRTQQQLWHQSVPNPIHPVDEPSPPFSRRYSLDTQIHFLTFGTKLLNTPIQSEHSRKKKRVFFSHKGIGVFAKIPIYAGQTYREKLNNLSNTVTSKLSGWTMELRYEISMTP